MIVIPAHPLALTPDRRLDERRQRALTRYYRDAGCGGIAVAVHTTQFSIREHGLLRPVLELAAEETRGSAMRRIAGVCGRTPQAAAEAGLALELGYHAGLLSLAAMRTDPIDALVDHARAVAEIIPVIGFYLQPAVGGRLLPYEFWRRFAEIENVTAIKIAPFNRYQTLDVLRAVADSGRKDIALYTGNDDAIVHDLITPAGSLRLSGGLLGHWAVWTRKAVELAERITAGENLLHLAWPVTDCNAAFFDSANQFHGCIAGLHEVLRRQGLLAGRWCLDPAEDLSPGQLAEIDRVYAAYPELNDDTFVAEHLDSWLK